MLGVTLLLTAVVASAASLKSYDGYKVVSVVPINDLQFRFLGKLQYESQIHLDFWTNVAFNETVDIMVPEQELPKLKKMFTPYSLYPVVKHDNVQRLLDTFNETHEQRLRERRDVGFAFDVYHPYEEIMAWCKELAEAHSDLITVGSVGTTYEGRDQMELTITEGEPGTKPIIWIDCGIHAREWVVPASCLWYMNEMVTKYGTDEEMTRLVKTYDWMFVPVLNADGYAYTHSDDRMWRKNRQPNAGSSCVGTDPNRNYDKNFGGPGSSSDPCNECYHGPEAFSAPMTANHRDRILELKPRLKMFYSMHSYSQLWMSPWAWTYDKPTDYEEMYRVAEIASKAVMATHNQNYKYGDTASVIYQCSGITIDWAYDVTGVTYTYTLEMRDEGYYNFILPEDQIIPNAEETWAGILAAVKATE